MRQSLAKEHTDFLNWWLNDCPADFAEVFCAFLRDLRDKNATCEKRETHSHLKTHLLFLLSYLSP